MALLNIHFNMKRQNVIVVIAPTLEDWGNFKKMRELLPDYIVTRNGFQGSGVIHIWER